jgi:hypothetical protein
MTKKMIFTAAVAATAAASSVLGLHGVEASKPPETTFAKAADVLGVDYKSLLDAFKKVRIEIVEKNIQNGKIDAVTGIGLIHKIEDSQDFILLPRVG